MFNFIAVVIIVSHSIGIITYLLYRLFNKPFLHTDIIHDLPKTHDTSPDDKIKSTNDSILPKTEPIEKTNIIGLYKNIVDNELILNIINTYKEYIYITTIIENVETIIIPFFLINLGIESTDTKLDIILIRFKHDNSSNDYVLSLDTFTNKFMVDKTCTKTIIHKKSHTLDLNNLLTNYLLYRTIDDYYLQQ